MYFLIYNMMYMTVYDDVANFKVCRFMENTKI